MKIAKINPIFTTILVAALSGCAASKPPLPDGRYTAFAQMWNAMEGCASEGHFSASTAAAGQRMLIQWHGRYSIDDARMHEHVRSTRGFKMPPSDCRKAEVDIARFQQQESVSNVQSAAQPTQPIFTIPKPIWCNRIGNTTMCN